VRRLDPDVDAFDGDVDPVLDLDIDRGKTTQPDIGLEIVRERPRMILM
jgi:hypothetical protein